ncbi:MAG: electron transfer flavoprotein subunit beta/FixA family protein [Burkholderiales bacterium]|nr:electron transfer flavoprotein subunit beta/FixA family protein [Burkholderiales bacterium]
MKVLVAAKRVVDPNVRVRVKADHSNVEIEHSKMSLNPFDENAIEEAVRLKEKGLVTEIVALSIGTIKSEETLRTALARGCDRAILVESNENYEPLNIAKIFAHIAKEEKPDLILLGKQAIDDDANQMAQMLAGKLNLPQVTCASSLDVNGNSIRVVREIDAGNETLEINLPAVISADLVLNEPRFIKLPQLMMAKKKPIEKKLAADLGLDLSAHSRLISVTDGEVKKQCKFLTNLNDVVNVIKANGV